MQKTILFMDNELNFLNVHTRLLEQAGYQVYRATTLAEAEEKLNEKHIHLAILDIRMEDENDEQDISGLILAQKEAYRPIPKIILTAYPSYEHAREALGPALNGLSPAVNFIGKAEGPKAMLQAVGRVFAQYIHINWDLVIRWRERERLSFPHLIALIEPEVDNNSLPLRVGELEDLFRRLFYDSTQINISHLFAQRAEHVFLAVFAYSKRGTERQFVIACGKKQSVANEDALYEEFVPKIVGESGIMKDKTVETIHFAATTYMLTGGNLEEITTFSEFYRTNSVEMVITALEYLFNTTLATWHERGRFRKEERTLNDFLAKWPELSEETLFQTKLEHQVETICTESLAAGLTQLDYSPHKLTFHPSGDTSVSYPNPISCLSETHIVFDEPALCGTIHGQLDGNSILADRQGRTWLIDFSQTGQGPLLYDFVLLETAIKCKLLTIPNVQAWHEMEKRLASLSYLGEMVDTEGLGSEVQKALHAISRVRQQALTVIGDDLDSYLGGLLFCAISQLLAYNPKVRHTHRELMPYLHSLLSAAMLCQKLTPSPRKDLPPEASYGLWLDESNKEVWVEGRLAPLTPREFKLLLHLYRYQGHLCDHATIAEQVFDVTYESDLSDTDKKRMEEGRINSAVSRLRKKVEPNPKRPKYIITVRGEGYRLNLEG